MKPLEKGMERVSNFNDVDQCKALLLEYFSDLWKGFLVELGKPESSAKSESERISIPELNGIVELFLEFVTLHLARIDDSKERIVLLKRLLGFVDRTKREFNNLSDASKRKYFEDLKKTINQDRTNLIIQAGFETDSSERQLRVFHEDAKSTLKRIKEGRYLRHVESDEGPQEIEYIFDENLAERLTSGLDAHVEEERPYVKGFEKQYAIFCIDNIASLRHRLISEDGSPDEIIEEWLKERELVFQKWLSKMNQKNEIDTIRNRVLFAFSTILGPHFEEGKIQAALEELTEFIDFQFPIAIGETRKNYLPGWLNNALIMSNNLILRGVDKDEVLRKWIENLRLTRQITAQALK